MRKTARRPSLPLLLLLLTLLACVLPLRAQDGDAPAANRAPAAATKSPWKVIAARNDVAPGTGEGGTFHGFENPVLNDKGQVAFLGTVDTGDIGGGVFMDTGKEIVLVAGVGLDLPKGNLTGKFDGFRDLNLTDFGEVSFLAAMVTEPADDNFCLWGGKPGSLALLVRGGSDGPGLIGTTFGAWLAKATPTQFPYLITNGCRTAFPMELINSVSAGEQGVRPEVAPKVAPPARVKPRGSSGDAKEEPAKEKEKEEESTRPDREQSIWTGLGLKVSLLARELPFNKRIQAVSFKQMSNPVISAEKGTTVFQAERHESSSAIWSDSTKRLATAVKSEDPASGFDKSATFRVMGPPSVNAAGKLAFRSNVLTGDFRQEEGVYYGDTGHFTAVAASSTKAPGAPKNAKFYNLGDPIISNRDHVAFTGTTAAPNGAKGAGLWVWSPTTKQADLVAFENVEVPNCDPKAAVGKIDFFSVNGLGQVAFIAEVLSVERDPQPQGKGLFVYDPKAGLVLLLRPGSEITLRGDQPQLVSSVSVLPTQTGGGDGRPRFLSDSGQIAALVLTGESEAIVLFEGKVAAAVKKSGND